MTYMWKEIMEQPAALKKSLETNAGVIDSLAELISERGIRNVVIAARGTSDHAAVYGKYVIEILTGMSVALAAPSVFTLYKSSLTFENTLVIGISQSGEASDVAEVLKAANAHGAVTVGITNFPDSPVARLSKYHLFCDTGIEKSVAATKTFTAELYLLGNLAAKLAGDSALLREFSAVPDKMKATFDVAGDIGEKAERYRFADEIFVLARGINYSIALETALKIQETTYVNAKAFAVSDFHHGPMAMMEKGKPVIIYAPSGPALDDVVSMISALKDAQADLFVVSDRQDICGIGDCSFLIPSTGSDFISPFCNVAVAQMFSCKLAHEKGLDPDKPRMLNKVTITR